MTERIENIKEYITNKKHKNLRFKINISGKYEYKDKYKDENACRMQKNRFCKMLKEEKPNFIPEMELVFMRTAVESSSNVNTSEAETELRREHYIHEKGEVYIDMLAARLLDAFADELEGRRNERGGIFRAGTGSAMYYIRHAEELGGSPDGRRKGEYFPANFSPSLFVKTKGPLSVIKSFTTPDLKRVANGGPLTLEFHDSVFRGEEGIKKVAALVRMFIINKGHQLQLNAINAEVLKEAQRHPENYKNLVVRVWGWSAYFVELDKVYQEHLIRRAEYSV